MPGDSRPLLAWPDRVRGDAYVPLDCRKCALHQGRTQVVPAEGASKPVAFFVGEGPGPDEDEQGRPFVGRAGKILRGALLDAGWTPQEIWITNVVKCFPHDRQGSRRKIRRPHPHESAACRGHLGAELGALRPRLVVALGKTAAEELTGRKIPRLEPIRGDVLPTRPELGDHWVFVTYHPSGLHYGHATVAEFTDDLRWARAMAVPEATPP